MRYLLFHSGRMTLTINYVAKFFYSNSKTWMKKLKLVNRRQMLIILFLLQTLQQLEHFLIILQFQRKLWNQLWVDLYSI